MRAGRDLGALALGILLGLVIGRVIGTGSLFEIYGLFLPFVALALFWIFLSRSRES